MSVYRYPWHDFPSLWIHAEERLVKTHPDYPAAKSGDPQAAFRLVRALVTEASASGLASGLSGSQPILVAAHAVESAGLNAIPQALALHLGEILSWPVETSVIQTNVVGHTGANGFVRLARQAEFDGSVSHGCPHIMVDDFVGQGGTLANLRGFLMHRGAEVLGGTVLTGKPYSAILSTDEEQTIHLRKKHGPDLESWWAGRFGFGYDCLTRSEARYLCNTPTVERIRNRIAAALETGNHRDRG